MATATWISNGQTAAQVDTITINTTANGAVFSAQVSNKILTYTSSGSETTASAASNFNTILNANGTPLEFSDISFSVANNVITATASKAGTPFTLVMTVTLGGSLTQVHTTLNSSPSDLTNPNNWLRNNSYALPQTGDDIVLTNTNVQPVLWNLDQLQIMPRSVTRWQSMQQQIGLPDWNTAGYYEYRAKYLTFGGGSSSSSSPGSSQLPLVLGIGSSGTGPPLERYNVLGINTNFLILASGNASGDYAVTLLGTNPGNTVKVQGASVGIGMSAGEIASLASAIVDGGGSLTMGPLVTFGGTLTANSAGSVTLYSIVQALMLQNGSSATLAADGVTWPSIVVEGGSSLTSLAGGTISSLELQTSSILDKSADLRTLTIVSAEIDGDTCTVNDPNSCLAWPNGALVNGQVQAGPFQTGPGRQWTVH